MKTEEVKESGQARAEHARQESTSDVNGHDHGSGIEHLAPRFLALFAGNDQAHGVYEGLQSPNEKGKVDGTRKLTILEKVSEKVWADHLAGRQGLGIIPVRTDDSAMFGVIDIDEYSDIDHKNIVNRLAVLKIPMAVLRSKSGGAHVVCRMREPVPASKLIARLREISAVLGNGAAEIFPKQDHIEDPKAGNWINMPYYSGLRGMRWCVRRNGDAMSAEEFLDYFESIGQVPAWLDEPLTVSTGLPDGPPCLQHLVQLGFPEGTRNKGLYNLGVYAQKADEDNWPKKLKEFNSKYMEPPLDDREVASVIKSLKKKTYNYQCSDALLKPYCNAGVCQQQLHGIGHGQSGKRTSDSELLLTLAKDFEHFRSGSANDAYVRVPMGNHKEVWKVDPKGSRVREILTHRFFMQYGRAPSREGLTSALDTIIAKCGAGKKVAVFVRFAARSRESIYLDMCDERWRAIEVTAGGWRIVEDPPVLFCRPSGALELPTPVGGGSIEPLRQLLNAPGNQTWSLMISWLIGTFLPEGAFTHLVLEGEQGSAKSTTARILQSLLDPSDAGLSAPPKDEADATIGAMNSGILAYDNLSGCRAELSDTLCRFSTGHGYKTRTLFETLGLTVVSLKIPVLLNGIDSTVMRGDLLERSIILKLPRIAPEKRQTEHDIWAKFAELHPTCLGAILDSVSCGLKNLGTTKIPDPPRMADFCNWVVACEAALPWKAGEFMAAYRHRLLDANRDLAESDQVASAIIEWCEKHLKPGAQTSLTAKDLLVQLNQIASDMPKDLRYWPLNPESLSHKLIRLAPVLRAAGIEIAKLPRTKDFRGWLVSRPGQQGKLVLLPDRGAASTQEEAA